MKVRDLIHSLLECDMDTYVFLVNGNDLEFVTYKPLRKGFFYVVDGKAKYDNFKPVDPSDGYYNGVLLTWD
jgi:hypothetical protein